MNVSSQTEPVDSSAHAQTLAWNGGAQPGAALSPASHSERLEYLCDMVGELRSMAEQSSLLRLATLLALAHEEAQQQRASR